MHIHQHVMPFWSCRALVTSLPKPDSSQNVHTKSPPPSVLCGDVIPKPLLSQDITTKTSPPSISCSDLCWTLTYSLLLTFTVLRAVLSVALDDDALQLSGLTDVSKRKHRDARALTARVDEYRHTELLRQAELVSVIFNNSTVLLEFKMCHEWDQSVVQCVKPRYNIGVVTL